ncbi:hypothetical protein MHBO_002598 [Bonamia ostreae]|uniref:Uncharacterized protein n=1 Tax=Bonamia ostreae TaxID=126728 RepID=A0ABV2ANM6_9EUKA
MVVTNNKKRKRVSFAVKESVELKKETFLEKTANFQKLQSKNLFVSNYGLLASKDKTSLDLYKNLIISNEYEMVKKQTETDEKLKSKSKKMEVKINSAKNGKKKDLKKGETDLSVKLFNNKKSDILSSLNSDYKKIIPAEFRKSAQQIALENQRVVKPQWFICLRFV